MAENVRLWVEAFETPGEAGPQRIPVEVRLGPFLRRGEEAEAVAGSAPPDPFRSSRGTDARALHARTRAQ